MTAVDRISKRLAKEDAEREVAYAKGAAGREARYQKMDALITRYDDERRHGDCTISEEARRLWGHLVDEYQCDLVEAYQRMRQGKTL